MTTELKPCPFCGGKAKLSTYRICEDAMGASVKCTSCFMTTTEYEDAYTPKADAIAAWNTRATPSPVPELVRYHHFMIDMKEAATGLYVLASEAERIIADQAKEAERLKDENRATFNTYLDTHNKVTTLEAELEEIGKQKPLYAHPVADHEVETIERCAKVADAHEDGRMKQRDTANTKIEKRDFESMAMSAMHIAQAIRALSGKEPAALALAPEGGRE